MRTKWARLYLDRLTCIGVLAQYDRFMGFLPKSLKDLDRYRAYGRDWPLTKQWPHGTRALGRTFEGNWTALKWNNKTRTWVELPAACIPFLELVAFPAIKEQVCGSE